MAALFPFRALRPTPAAASDVAAVPYDVVTRDEAASIAHGNPLSFLHVSRAEIDVAAGTDPYADEVYDKAARNFLELQAAAPLVTEDVPSLYVYRLKMGPHEQTGIAACFSLDDYDTDIIKKHERTRRDKEDDRTRHMLAIGAQTGPVFLTYRAAPHVSDLVDQTVGTEPLFDFMASDHIGHTVWKVRDGDRNRFVDAFAAVPALYIADGHHRAASAARARKQKRSTAGAGEWDTFLGVAFPHDQVQILAYNRIIKDLAGASPASVLSRLRERFVITSGPSRPVRRGDVSMYLDGVWYTIELGEPSPSGPIAGRLDVDLLQELILGPVLGIGDVRTDKRIDFVGGARGTEFLEQSVSSGGAAVAFSLYPVSVDDLMAISDAGGIMPPKSTWFEPKLRDGLLSHVF
ncbi:MAG TPA: DUF1015 family protein [Vicinamibacterales bacterium]|nr:DUF1015 family protein [Vicinamibacterales bacterium]